MTHAHRSFRLSRRAFAGGAATAAVALRLDAFAQDSTPAGGQPESDLEIFSYWTAAGEAQALQALFDAFSAQWPDVNIVNAAVAGGAGSNAQVALETRLSADDPPDSWQSHPGEELYSLYVDPKYVQPLGTLWDEQGWGEVVPQGLIDQFTRDGEHYLVPVGVHRGNVMFYNKQLLADNGLEIGDTLSVDQFMQIGKTLQDAGIPALALGSKDTFAAPKLLENVLLAQLGTEAYNGLWNGETAWDSDDVGAGLQVFHDMLEFVNDNHAVLTWDGAMDLVIDGTAAVTSMGDWAWGQAVAKGAEDKVGWVAHAGSDFAFIAVVDGFVLPVSPPHPVNTKNWLRTVGSVDAQRAFAPIKGAIPARTDVDTSQFGPYLQWSAKDFATIDVVASMAHGAAASPQWRQSIFDATISFLASRDVGSYQDELTMAAEDAMAEQ